MTDRLLLIEDERLLGTELKRQFARSGWEVTWVEDLADAKHALESPGNAPLLVLADMTLPDGNSLDLLEEVRGRNFPGEWIFLTGYGDVPDSVRALRLGAYDFLTKPCDSERLNMVVRAAARGARAQRQLRELADSKQREFSPQAFIGQSPAAEAVREVINQLLPVPVNTLILSGETGTGKGLVARILHHSGLRREGPMIEVNCAALPRELLESELFGHEPGAFTGARGRRRGRIEQADGGTLFLDEIGEISTDLQAKLLRVIEDKRFWRLGGEKQISVDCQIIAASNRDLASLVKAGKFRADLYHRLNVLSIELPALRSRVEDLSLLVPAFLAHFNARVGKNVRFVPEPVWERLRTYRWPGNVRELRNVLERCVLLANDETLPDQWLRLETDEHVEADADEGATLRLPIDGRMSLDDMERTIIEKVLSDVDRNVSRAARLLGVSRETLRYRVQKH
ncbi:MAG: sigma-54 dependent transcriptional regulator, partial [Lysobacterales bacterium]